MRLQRMCVLLPSLLVAGLATLHPAGAYATPGVHAQAEPAVSCRQVRQDDEQRSSVSFTGDVNANDVAVGVPGAPLGPSKRAGLVEVRYACGLHTGTDLLRLPLPHAGDRFGAAMAVASLNADRYDDLVVGVPGLDVGHAKGAGGVAVFLGSATGLMYAATLTQGSPGVPGRVQAGAAFGAALSDGTDLPSEPWSPASVAVGAPDANVGHAVDAGAVEILAFNGSAVDPDSSEFTLSTPGVSGKAQRGDHLGAAIGRLGDHLDGDPWLFGLPGRKVSGHAGAGAVVSSDGRLYTQNTPGFPDRAETGDHFGAAVADGWIGVPGEDLGGVKDAGMVSSVAAEALTLASATGARAHRGDHFGAALLARTEPGLPLDLAPDEILVGIPGRTVAGVVHAGSIISFPYVRGGSPAVGQSRTTSMSDPARAAHFGSTMTQAGFTTLVAAPGVGRVVLYDRPGVDVPTVHTGFVIEGSWLQSVGTYSRTSGFGSSLGHVIGSR